MCVCVVVVAVAGGGGGGGGREGCLSFLSVTLSYFSIFFFRSHHNRYIGCQATFMLYLLIANMVLNVHRNHKAYQGRREGVRGYGGGEVYSLCLSGSIYYAKRMSLCGVLRTSYLLACQVRAVTGVLY